MNYWHRKYHKYNDGYYTAKKNGKSYDLELYLHGLCDIFAVELAKHIRTQGLYHEICIMTDEEGLIHCFLLIESPEEDIRYYIDVRGITSDEDEFFGEFADFFDYELWKQGDSCEEDILCFNDIDTFMKKVHELTEIDYSHFRKEAEAAKNIIKTFTEYYTLPDGILRAVQKAN